MNEYEERDRLMAAYNFDLPIKVTLIIEDEDPADPFSLPVQVSETISVQREKVCDKFNRFKAHEKPSDTKNNNSAKNERPRHNKSIKSTSTLPNNNYSTSIDENVSEDRIQVKYRDFQWRLLNPVAENLINICKCYYHNIIGGNKQRTDYDKLKSEYLIYKHHFFNLSYSTTIAILIPQEHNQHFFNRFVERIIQIANRNSWYEISTERLNVLIRDMLLWTKQKKKYIETNFAYPKCATKSVTPSFTSSFNYFNPKTNYCTPTVNIRHVANNTYKKDTTSLKIIPRVYNLPQEKNNSFSNTRTFHSTHANDISSNIDPTRNHIMQEKYYPLDSTYGINSSTQEISNPLNTLAPSNQEEWTPFFNNNSERNVTSNVSDATHSLLISTGPPNREIRISVAPPILNNLKKQNTIQNENASEVQTHEVCGTASIKRQKTNDNMHNQNYNTNNTQGPNEKSHNYQKYNNTLTSFRTDDNSHSNYNQFYNSKNIESNLQNTNTSRSSISRDSGFASPPNTNFSNEEMMGFFDNREQEETPFISHITSMNPNAINLKNGNCKVCGASTNKMCIACYQQYYCSTLCQREDWNMHKYMCTG